eukprot:10225324-Karenia_brevis.AAC.1
MGSYTLKEKGCCHASNISFVPQQLLGGDFLLLWTTCLYAWQCARADHPAGRSGPLYNRSQRCFLLQ